MPYDSPNTETAWLGPTSPPDPGPIIPKSHTRPSDGDG